MSTYDGRLLHECRQRPAKQDGASELHYNMQVLQHTNTFHLLRTSHELY